MATNPKPVKPSINPRSPDFTDCFSPVFGNSCLDLVVVSCSCGRELVDPLVLVDSEVLTDVLVLIVSEALVTVEADVLALIDAETLALADADVLADMLALVEADMLADVLALVEADVLADALIESD